MTRQPRFGLPLLLSLGALAVLTLTGLTIAEEEVAQQGAGSSALLVPGRSNLGVCVDSFAEAPISSEDILRVERALERVASGTRYGEFYPSEREVARGCPPPTLIGAARATTSEGERRAVYLSPSELPSQFRVFMYLMSPVDYSSMVGSAPYFRAPAEMVCDGPHVCANVTTALYVPNSGTEEAMVEGLLAVLGLSAPQPDPTYAPGTAEERRADELDQQ